jgi:hypothetical protein
MNFKIYRNSKKIPAMKSYSYLEDFKNIERITDLFFGNILCIGCTTGARGGAPV